jgi:resuscitation-promoting factor RpfB
MYHHDRILVPLAAVSVLALGGCAAEAGQATDPQSSPTHARTKPAKRDVVKHRLVRVKQRIGFDSDTIRTSSLDKGETQLQQAGRAGVRVRVVKVTVKNGVEVGRDVVRTFVARPPVQRVTLVGTHVDPKPKPAASSCDGNYTGACEPVASDVDCGGGSGDGPAYVDGPVEVVGTDVYDLDNDGDGVACDS